MTTQEANELFKRAQVIKAKCEEYIKYNGGSDESAFALGIELLASGQLFTEAAGHACQPATSNNHLMFGVKMTKDESAIISLIVKQMHLQYDVNNVPSNDILIAKAAHKCRNLLQDLNKPKADLYDLNAEMIKTIAGLLYAAINIDLTFNNNAAVACLPSGYEGC